METLVRNSLDELYNTWSQKYGDLKIDENAKRIRVVAVTGGWFENEKAIDKFNKITFEDFTFKELFLVEWKRGGRWVYEIPKSLFKNNNGK